MKSTLQFTNSSCATHQQRQHRFCVCTNAAAPFEPYAGKSRCQMSKLGAHMQGVDLERNTRCKTKEQVQQQMPRLVGPLLLRLTWPPTRSISGPWGQHPVKSAAPRLET